MKSSKKKNKLPTKQPVRRTQETKNPATTSISRSIQSQFSGPIPPPEILHGYDQIVPGAAERILKMAELDAEHQRDVEQKAITYTFKERKRGQIFGLAIAIAAFGTSIVALYLGFEKAAITIGGTTVVGLVATFVTGQFIKPKQ